MEEIEDFISEIEKLEERKVELETELNLTDEKINECKFQISELREAYLENLRNDEGVF